MTYAVARKLDPATGQPSLQTSGRWVRATSPALEMVKLCLKTQAGDCPVDPELGVNWRAVNKLRTSAPADAEGAIRAGLGRLVRAGHIRDVKVSAAVLRGALTYEVSFVDVLLQQRITTQGTAA